MPALVLFALAVAGCAKDKQTDSTSITGPTPVILGAPLSVAVAGSTELTRIGETSQLHVIAAFADGTTQDVTAASGCRGLGYDAPYTVFNLTSDCLVTAVAYGRQDLVVTYPRPNWWPAPPSSLQSTVTVRVAPSGTFVVYGNVAELGYGLADAQVTVTSDAGRREVQASNRNGNFMLTPVTGEVSVRVDLAGYQSQERRLRVQRDERLDFSLQRETDSPDITGIYQLTFTASRSCTMPEPTRQRIYAARIVSGNTMKRPEDLVVTITGPGLDFVGWGNDVGFTGARSGSDVRFTITSNIFDADYALVELIDSHIELSFDGMISAAVGNQRIEGLFDGTMKAVDRFTRANLGECRAADHRVVFTR